MLYLLDHSRTLVVQVKGNICLVQLEFALSLFSLTLVNLPFIRAHTFGLSGG